MARLGLDNSSILVVLNDLEFDVAIFKSQK